MTCLLTFGIFFITLVLILTKPKGLNEAWFTVAGAIGMLVLGLETPLQAVETIHNGKDVLLFLLGLLILAELMRISGFFDWAAIYAARTAHEDGKKLFLNIFILGAVVTAFLSLDTTAVMLTPVVLAFVKRLKLEAKPFLFICAYVANSGSLVLQVSNLTNLLFAHAFKWNFTAFTARMFLPQVMVLGVHYIAFVLIFQDRIPKTFLSELLPNPQDVIPNKSFFHATVMVFVVVLIGYFVGSAMHIPPYLFALTGAFVLGLIGIKEKVVKMEFLSEISWSVFPFVMGLFVVVRAIENLGAARLLTEGLTAVQGSKILTVLFGTFGAGIGSNVLNNIPMALLSISSAKESGNLARYAMLIGCNVGPTLMVTGSLATMLVITTARNQGEKIDPIDFLKVGILLAPLLLLTGSLSLIITDWLVGM